MNRRSFTTVALGAALLPVSASMKQQEATPHVLPDSTADLRTRNLTAVLTSVAPSDLLAALESAEVTDTTLIDANRGIPPVSVPWADYGDIDLYSSLGGVGLTSGSTNLSDPDTEMLGAYIVYESTEIAYHEFTRKLGDIYENPSMTMSIAGTNVWIVESEDLQIGTLRIGNVMMIALSTDRQGTVVDGIIAHLADVAANTQPTD